MWLHPVVESACEDGTVYFQDGCFVLAIVILHCTGYKYHFPLLETDGIVTVDDNRVGPLYKHIVPPVLAPWLSFVGLPWKVLPFPIFELQSKWIAGALSNRFPLPSQEEMMEDVEASTHHLKLLAHLSDTLIVWVLVFSWSTIIGSRLIVHVLNLNNGECKIRCHV